MAMHDVLSHIPKNEDSFENAKRSMMEKMEAERFTKLALLQQYENLRRLGIQKDVREDIYGVIPSLTLSDIQRIRDEKIGDKKFALLVIGSKNKIQMSELAKYGEIEQVTLEDIFGY